MYGTLLSLYPLGAKRPVFKARVMITERMGVLLRSSCSEKRDFIRDHMALVKLCFIEHTINMLDKFMPCERDLLISTNDCMELFESLVVSMCDSFR